MTKKEYINVYKCRENFYNDILNILSDDTTNDRANEIIDVFDNLPTVDVQEVKHSRWKISNTEFGYNNAEVPIEWKCSLCGYAVEDNYLYCPYCGARMDDENEK